MNLDAPAVLHDAFAQMSLRIRKAWNDWRNAPDSLSIRGVRIEVSLPTTDPFEWLLAQRHPEQILWSARDESDICAGVGVCHLLSGPTVEAPASLFARGREILSAFGNNAPRYFGGFAFSAHATDEAPWPRFGPSRFVIPRAEVTLRQGQSSLVCNLLFRRDAEHDLSALLDEWHSVAPALCLPGSLPTLSARRDFPPRSGWEANVASALDLIRNGVLDKIVLARKAVYTFADPVTAIHILSVLRPVTSRCFHFLLQPSHEAAFMGSTPERLYRREGRELLTEALAGTRPRDPDPELDALLARQLLDEPKERREQEFVRRDLLRHLHLLSEHVWADEQPSLLQLERKQHLLSRLTARLRPGVDDDQLLRALHPTPAVGGSPRENALREIQRLEPFARGWYAAPVGWFGPDAAEFAVAIRSGLVHGRNVNIYSGAGIVEGSQPAEEWQEIENKISDFVKVTSGKGRRS